MAQYQTTDIFKGAFLLCKGGDLSGISFNDRRIASFSIIGKGIHQLDKDYDQGVALVNPVNLRESLNHLRDILFEMKDRRRNSDRPNRNNHHQARR